MRRARLAVITPWPPARSGVANHSQKLVTALAEHADIDVIVDRDDGLAGHDPSPDPRVEVRSHFEFDWLRPLRGYDRILSVLGNSRFHVHALRHLLGDRGHVLMHDVRLTGLYIAATSNGSGDSASFREKVVQMYGDRIPRRALRRLPDVGLEERYSIFMTQEVQEHADLLMTHSHHALDLLRLERGPGGAPPRGEVVSHGVWEPQVDAEERRSEGPLIVSFGAVAMVKGLDVILGAFSRLVDERPGARLAFVGHTTDNDGRFVRTLASELGIADNLELRGHVAPDEYWRILRSADIAIQLRTWSNGEASGAVIDCVAARVPTIVSDIGWFSELPDQVVLPVPRDSPPERIAEQMGEVLDDAALRAEIEAAQDEYVAANSYTEVARRYAEILGL
jgi:glycosyltransferase involved in cell wall biosynthesis